MVVSLQATHEAIDITTGEGKPPPPLPPHSYASYVTEVLAWLQDENFHI